MTFVMEEAFPGGPDICGEPDYPVQSFKKTCNYWRAWIGRCTYNGRWREAVHRSALALKLLTSRKHGSVIAAPCFGFPNEVGGERNWDYRYTWLRDASFSTYALIRLGYTEEAEGFMRWLEDRINELGPGEILQTMYRIDGSRLDGEFHLDQLEGYCRSKPVRIGSTNHDQLQLDVFGEVMDSVYLYDKYGSPISQELWSSLRKVLDYVCEHWRDADAGIWEFRGGHQEFLFSRVLCWVAMDRGLRLAQKRGLPAPKWLSTLKAVTEDLVEDSLVYRYRVGEAFSDELKGGEGTFSICSFWYIECVSRTGDLQMARYLFEKMLGYSNSLGLFSEQLGSKGEFLGNVPQAFSHLAMISAAFDLDRRLDDHPSRGVSGGLG